MDTRLNNVIASGLAFLGALGIYFGFADEATWAKVGGALSTLIAVLMPFVMKPKEPVSNEEQYDDPA